MEGGFAIKKVTTGGHNTECCENHTEPAASAVLEHTNQQTNGQMPVQPVLIVLGRISRQHLFMPPRDFCMFCTIGNISRILYRSALSWCVCRYQSHEVGVFITPDQTHRLQPVSSLHPDQRVFSSGWKAGPIPGSSCLGLNDMNVQNLFSAFRHVLSRPNLTWPPFL